MIFNRIAGAFACALLLASPASAQLIGSGHVMGNGNASPAVPADTQLLNLMGQPGSGIGSGVPGVLGQNGALGPFTAGLPIIGNGSSGFAAGSKSGTTNVFPVIDGTSVNGQCAVFDSAGGFTSTPCPGGGSGSGTVSAGLAQQYAYYPNNGTAVVGFQAPFLHSKNFGALGDGTTDDSVALQNWANACEASGQICYLDPGIYVQSTAGLSVTKAITIRGAGYSSPLLFSASKGSTFAPGVAITAISIASISPVNLSDFSIAYTTQPHLFLPAINVTGPGGASENFYSTFRNLIIDGPGIGINYDGAVYSLTENVGVTNFRTTAFSMANTTNGDDGDNHLAHSHALGGLTAAGSFTIGRQYRIASVGSTNFVAIGAGSNTQGLIFTASGVGSGTGSAAGDAGSCITWNSSGGFFVDDFSCLSTQIGFQMIASHGVNTSQIQVQGGSFDSMIQGGFQASRADSSAFFTHLYLTGVTCNNMVYCLNILPDAVGAWISNVTVTGGSYSTPIGLNTAGTFVLLNGTSGAMVGGTSLLSTIAGSRAFACPAGSGAIVFGPFSKTGLFSANNNACSATTVGPT